MDLNNWNIEVNNVVGTGAREMASCSVMPPQRLWASSPIIEAAMTVMTENRGPQRLADLLRVKEELGLGSG